MIPHGRTPDWSIPHTLGAPLGPNIDILMPEPSDDFDDEFAATTTPARAATTVLERREPPGRTRDDPDVPRRTRIVPTARCIGGEGPRHPHPWNRPPGRPT